jgi:hypothetical protein
MKIALPTANGKPSSKKRIYVAPIPLERKEKKKYGKNEVLSYKLRSNPAEENSPVYEFSVPFFEAGTPEEVIDFVVDVERVITGLNMTNGPPKYAQMRRLLRGDALAAFDSAATEAGNETNANYVTSVRGFVTHFFPPRALAVQKRVMRRFMRKPTDMKMRKYQNRVEEMNRKLARFPPNFNDDQKLADDELIDISEFGIPNAWQREMIVQDFDPMEHTLQELIQFCERMERAEGSFDMDAKIPKKDKSSKEQKANKNSPKWCEFCEMNNHNTNECGRIKELKRQRNEQRQRGYERRQDAHTNAPEAKRQKTYGDKVWQRKDYQKSDKKVVTKEQLNSMIANAVSHHLKRATKAEEFNVTEEQRQLAEGLDDIHLQSSESEENHEELHVYSEEDSEDS